jgi:hypothetical protein
MDLAASLTALAAGVDGDDAPFFQTFSDIKAIIHTAAPAATTTFLDVLDPLPGQPGFKQAATRQGCLYAFASLVALKLGRPEPGVQPAGEKRAILAAVCVSLAALGLVPEGVNVDELMSA